MSLHKEKTLSEELIAGLLVIVTITTLLVTGAHLALHFQETRRDFRVKSREYIRFLQEALSQPIWHLDQATVTQISKSFLKIEMIDGIRVENERGELLFASAPSSPEGQGLPPTAAPILFDEVPIGHVTLWITDAPRKAAAMELLWGSVATLVITLLVIAMVTRFFVSRFFRRPMISLMARMEKVACGEFSFADTAFRHKETNGIFQKFTEMAQWVHRREASLERLNRNLQSEIRMRERITVSLRQSEQRWSDIVHFAPIAIYQSNLDGRLLLANPQMARVFGFRNPEEMMAAIDHMADLYAEPEERNRLVEAIQSEGALSGVEVRLRHHSGRPIWCNLSSRKTERDGETVFEGFLLDVSEQKLFEEALRESERQKTQIINFLPDPTFVVDDEGKVIAWNHAIAELTGVSAENMVGKGDFEYALPFYKERRPILIDLVRIWEEETARKYTYVRKKGNALVSETVNPPFRPDDSCFWNAACPLFDDAGRMVGAIETIRDISEAKRVERSLRESEFRFRSFFNSSPDGIVIIDLNGRILDVNRSLLQLTGWQREDILYTHFSMLTPEDHHPGLNQAIETFRRGIAPDFPMEIDYLSKDGPPKPARIRAWLVTDQDSHPMGIGAFIKDISREESLTREKAELEKQLQQTQKMEAIGTLAGGIAHDFNNILAGIIGYAELIKYRSSDPSEKIAGYLNRILEATHRARDIVRQILQFSREESATYLPIEIRPVVKETLKLLRATLPPSIEIFDNISSENDSVLADPTRIHQVLMNLCTNAYHAMGEAGGALIVGLEKTILEAPRQFQGVPVPPGPYLRLTVSDTGHGIDPAVLDRIFDPYFTTKNRNEGTGLGLSVTLGIVKNLKGMIEVESQVGAGTTFSIYLPLVDSVARTAEVASEGGIPTGGSERILLVDDEAFFLESIQEHLGLLGYAVTAENSSLAALERFRADPMAFDLVLTDQAMPEMTGLQFCARIRELNQNVPIILCTGFSDQVNEHTAGHFGIAKFLMKPVRRSELARAISGLLDPSRVLQT